MRILFATTRTAGHLGPLVPFARACERAGHEVLVAAARSCAPHVGRAGLPLAPLEDPSDAVLAPMWARVHAAQPEEAARIVMGEIYVEHARAALPGMLATMRDWRPDVVLRETCEYASVVAADAFGLPHLHVAIFLAAGGELDWAHLDEPMNALRAEAGLRPDPYPERLWQEPYLTMAPRSLEDPSTMPPPGTRRFHEPAAPEPPLPDWWRGQEGPLVYVSFGSVVAGAGFYPAIYRATVDALAGLRARVLLTIGTEVDKAELGPVPSSVHVESWVPQAAVMPHAAAMLGHGGSGSTLMAMAAGLPLGVVPLFADQGINARRVAALGAGLDLSDAASLAGPVPLDDALALDRLDGLRDAVTALLEDPRYREAAGAVAAEIAMHPPIDAVVEILADIARGEALAA